MRRKHKRLKIQLQGKIENDQELLVDGFFLFLKIAGILFIAYWIFRL